MKLSVKIPLEEKKAKAIAEIDEASLRRCYASFALQQVYAAKHSLASDVLNGQTEPPQWLVTEASSKGIAIDALCQQILSKGTTQDDYLEFEGLRQTLKAAIRDATSEQEINQIVGGYR